MARVPELNRRLLHRVKRYILEQPARLEMNGFHNVLPEDEGGPACGTQACIAGWAVLLGKNVPKMERAGFIIKRSWGETARRLLGLTHLEAHHMFYEWKYDSGRPGAKEAARKIDFILKDRDTFVVNAEKLMANRGY
jgi:hypothetical protein